MGMGWVYGGGYNYLLSAGFVIHTEKGWLGSSTYSLGTSTVSTS